MIKPSDQRDLDKARTFQFLALLVALIPLVGTVAAGFLWWQGWRPGWAEAGLFALFYLITLTGIEVGFHRHLSHQAFSCKSWLTTTLTAFGSMAFQGPVIWWAATHRRHHQFVDTAGDPHSPYWTASGTALGFFAGFFHSHIGWLFQMKQTHPEGWAKWGRDMYCQPVLLTFQINYLMWPILGLLLPGALGGLLGCSWRDALMGFLWGGCVRLLAVNHIYWSINSLCHLLGPRQFSKKTGHSCNIPLLALFSLGQSWHRNHHQQPTSAYVGHHWWQVDPGAWMIVAWKKLGWVEQIRPLRFTLVNQESPDAAHPD